MTIRRLGDIALALALFVVCLPAIVLAIGAVAIEFVGAPLHRVERVTRDGRIVRLWRLRVMRDTQFGPKLTRTGAVLRRYHLDQIPQLWNVVLGDLSLLAPAPDTMTTRKEFAVREH